MRRRDREDLIRERLVHALFEAAPNNFKPNCKHDAGRQTRAGGPSHLQASRYGQQWTPGSATAHVVGWGIIRQRTQRRECSYGLYTTAFLCAAIEIFCPNFRTSKSAKSLIRSKTLSFHLRSHFPLRPESPLSFLHLLASPDAAVVRVQAPTIATPVITQ